MGILLGTLGSCALLFPDRTAPKSSAYTVNPPPSPWHRLAVGDDPSSIDAMKADLAYENPESGAIISLNSICRKYSPASLEVLTDNLVRGISERKVEDQKQRMIAGADALDTTFGGVVDNVRVRIRTVVMIKDSCTYDFIYVLAPQHEAKNGAAFDEFLASFRVNEK